MGVFGHEPGLGDSISDSSSVSSCITDKHSVRVTPAEKKLLEEFAGKEGVTVSKYIHKRLFG